MASEQTVIAIAMFAVSFLWYSNELNKRDSYLWGQAFQVFSFLFMICTFTICGQMFTADGYFDLTDLVLGGLLTLITWLMWALVLTWIGSLIINIALSMKNRDTMESASSIGVNRFGPK
jgi:hypothetical protein